MTTRTTKNVIAVYLNGIKIMEKSFYSNFYSIETCVTTIPTGTCTPPTCTPPTNGQKNNLFKRQQNIFKRPSDFLDTGNKKQFYLSRR